MHGCGFSDRIMHFLLSNKKYLSYIFSPQKFLSQVINYRILQNDDGGGVGGKGGGKKFWAFLHKCNNATSEVAREGVLLLKGERANQLLVKNKLHTFGSLKTNMVSIWTMHRAIGNLMTFGAVGSTLSSFFVGMTLIMRLTFRPYDISNYALGPPCM